MNILLVWPAAGFSVWDVASGYKHAFERQGHDVRDYFLGHRMVYHSRAMDPASAEDIAAVSKQASETVLLEAIYHEADLVVIVSGLVFHPIGLYLLAKARFPTIIMHTESPYEDGNQKEWSDNHPDAFVCTHERTSAEKHGWFYLSHAYDVGKHVPAPVGTDPDIDVLFIGTGWPERVQFLSAINWSGINFALKGLFPVNEDSPLKPYYEDGNVDNLTAAALYHRSKICINMHRASADAESLNPRAYELAACGAFTLTDYRAEGVEVFGEAQPVFNHPADLEALIRYYLNDPEGRKRLAEQARQRVQAHSFDHRAAALLAAWNQRIKG
jgi:spore maturation protein CgeB